MSFHNRLPVIPHVPGGHYNWQTYANRPVYYGYNYYVPDYSYKLNYTVPFMAINGDTYSPHYYYPRPYNAHNRYEQTQNVVCYGNASESHFCPVNTSHVTDKQGQHLCHYKPTNRLVSAPASLDACQDPANWPAAIAFDQLED